MPLQFNRKLRSQRLRKLAAQLDLTYTLNDEWGIQQRLGDFRLFRRTWGSRLHHLMTKEDQLLESRIHIFDYRYLRYGGKGRRKRVTQTVFFLDSRRLGLAEFYMRPENFFHKIGEALGLTEDIDFAEYKGFSDNYRLTSPHEGFVRTQFNDEILRFFTIEKGWSMEGMGYYLLLYKHGKVLDAKTIKRFYAKGMAVYEAFA
ncbi:MAG: hypothetical protein AAGJ82_06290, partial [Bacteroidota bacterium]